MQQINDLPAEFFEGKDFKEEMDKRLKEELDLLEGLKQELHVTREFYGTQEEFLAAKNKHSTKVK